MRSAEPKPKLSVRRVPRKRARLGRGYPGARVTALIFLAAVLLGIGGAALQAEYTLTLRSPLRIRWQWPLVIAPRVSAEDTAEAQADQFGHRLTAFQQYACNKFGPACRTALAIQRAENASGACEVYHYNTDGTLDWGYFQINTVHLKRPGLNLRDLLDCKANIDFAYQLYQEKGFQPWSTYNNGAYRQFLRAP